MEFTNGRLESYLYVLHAYYCILFQLVCCLRGHFHRTLFALKMLCRTVEWKMQGLECIGPSSTCLQKQLKSNVLKCKKRAVWMTHYVGRTCSFAYCIKAGGHNLSSLVTSGLVCFTVVETGTNTYLKWATEGQILCTLIWWLSQMQLKRRGFFSLLLCPCSYWSASYCSLGGSFLSWLDSHFSSCFPQAWKYPLSFNLVMHMSGHT